MSHQPRPNSQDVDQLLLNARLRDEMEPFLDESMNVLNLGAMPTRKENEYLASMLAWERAPMLPISQWFEPELALPRPELLTDAELKTVLGDVLRKLYQKKVALEFTEHLTDRQLYCIIVRDILPACEKKIDLPRNYLHWRCLDPCEDEQTWLRYYATEEERQEWTDETGYDPPAAEQPPYPRPFPRKAK